MIHIFFSSKRWRFLFFVAFKKFIAIRCIALLCTSGIEKKKFPEFWSPSNKIVYAKFNGIIVEIVALFKLGLISLNIISWWNVCLVNSKSKLSNAWIFYWMSALSGFDLITSKVALSMILSVTHYHNIQLMHFIVLNFSWLLFQRKKQTNVKTFHSRSCHFIQFWVLSLTLMLHKML